MCRIKTGKEIEKMNDIQNMVTSYILRASSPYSIQELSEKVFQSCSGANFNISKQDVSKLVTETTMALLRARYISSNSNGFYSFRLKQLQE